MGKTQHLRIFQPHPGLYAYYDGRVPGYRFMEGDNWVDEGAIGLGIATYALVAGQSALVYDTSVSSEHGAAIRAHLEAQGVTEFTVIYSHWHLDHVAGTSAFANCEVIANARTAAHLAERRDAIEAGTCHGLPEIKPLILPTRVFSGQFDMIFGDQRVTLIEANIHSDDATVLWLPEQRILLAGDTVEDCVTYVDEPANFAAHLRDLDRLAALEPRFVLPDHGAPDILARGGYDPEVIRATQRYIRWLMGLEAEPEKCVTPLQEIIADDLAAGILEWFAPYADIHAQNVQRTLELYGHD